MHCTICQEFSHHDQCGDATRSSNMSDSMIQTPENQADRYIAYPKALKFLIDRWKATPEELAIWIFLGPQQGGIAAYTNANELNPPPQFYYGYYFNVNDYIEPLMACWFEEKDITDFQPTERFITGKMLIERWSNWPGIRPSAFILSKIAESSLTDLHPTRGATEATFSAIGTFPTLETGLFAMSEVREIERKEFGEGFPEVSGIQFPPGIADALNNASAATAQAEKPWLIHNPADPAPKFSWYTPARYFARKLIRKDETLILKRDLLAEKVADMLTAAKIYKRGGKKPFNPATVKKAFSNVVLA